MKSLRATDVQRQMQQLGMSASLLAEQMGVSRQTVSNWLNGRDLPRPDKLLRLSLALKLSLSELIEAESRHVPVVAYRMSTNRKARDTHYERAVAKGEALEALVPHLPFDTFVQPKQLKNPKADYAYVQSVARSLRAGLGLDDSDHLWFNHLIGRFKDLQSVIVPVLWGKQDSHHANALHIYLPQHASTWVYLNLDSNAFDFMFWMAHELAHAYTSALCGTDAGEDFADMLASALLFPEPCAKNAYEKLSTATGRQLIEAIVSEALERHIDAYTVFKQINAYAMHHGLPPVEVNQQALHGTRRKIAAATQTISEIIFGEEKPSAREYRAKCEEAFETPLFKAMSAHIRATGAPASFVQHILDMPFSDAQALHAELRV